MLIVYLARKLTHSRLAAFLTPLLWLANPSLVLPMAWTSAYNEIQCTTFLLTSFALFIRYTETENKTYLWAQYVTFCLGFGSNELMVVYPGIAAAYVFLFRREYLRKTTPMFIISAVFAVIHRIVGYPAGGPYSMSFRPTAILFTFVKYLGILFSGFTSGVVFGWSALSEKIWAVALIAVLVGFAIFRALRRDYIALFGLDWFAIVLGPFLLLPRHITSYYVMIPAIGAAIAAAYALAYVYERSRGLTVAATLAAGVYLLLSSVTTYRQMEWHFNRASRAHAFVDSVVEAKRQHPGNLVLLDNIDDQLFWAAVYDLPFRRIFSWRDVLLTPRKSRPNSRSQLSGFSRWLLLP